MVAKREMCVIGRGMKGGESTALSEPDRESDLPVGG
jgi:hypothetical protein